MAYQGSAYETIVRLTNVGAYGPEPVLGVEAANVNLTYRPTGTYGFIIKFLVDNVSWFEIGDGYYVVVWYSSELSTQGELFFSLKNTGYASFDDVTGKFDVLAAPFETISSPSVCVISGSIVDLGGEPSEQEEVSFKLAKTPSVVGGAIFGGKVIRTVANAYGNFSVALVRGKKVLVEIEKSGLKSTITVPDQATANLLDLLPPIID